MLSGKVEFYNTQTTKKVEFYNTWTAKKAVYEMYMKLTFFRGMILNFLIHDKYTLH